MISFGVDIGGTGCKCVAFRDDGVQLAVSYREYPNPPGKDNLEPEILRDSVFEVIHDCAMHLENRREVAAITVSSFGESFVAVDAAGDPLGDIIMYFANSENSDFSRLVDEVGQDRFIGITKVLPDASYSLSKMRYTLQTAPRPVWKFLLVASYITFCLSGAAITDYSLACRTILFDVEKRQWSGELLQRCGIDRSMLPEVVPTGSMVGTLLPDLAHRLGLEPDVKIVIGSHDQIVNALGAGVHAVGDCVDTTGTCECIAPIFAQIPDTYNFQRENYACVPFLQDIGYITYAYNISGGTVVKWYRDTLAKHLREQAAQRGCSIYDLLNEVCPQEPTDLIVLPHLQGMGGTPDVQTEARGMIAGLSMNTSLPTLYRSILEGLTYEMAYNMERLAVYGISPKSLYACGGGARSRIWLQIKADIWNRPVIPSLVEETGALGSAILGFANVMEEKDVFQLAAALSRCGEPVLPIAEHTAFYQQKLEAYKTYRAFSLAQLTRNP